jgi:predicted enzyme related to lactoylglutathione lyase
METGKITGLGGVFLKFRDPAAMRSWYKDTLGITTNDYGVLFRFNHGAGEAGFLQLGTFEEKSDYFGSPAQQVMLNFRVAHLDQFLTQLQGNGVKIVNEIASYPFGKFLHIEDPEGNRIELWEPVSGADEDKESYTDMY